MKIWDVQYYYGRDDRWNSEAMAFLEIGSLSGKQEQEYGIKKGRESRFVERNKPVDEAELDLVTEINDLLLPGTSSFADPGFSGFPRIAHRSRHSLVAHTCVYIKQRHAHTVYSFISFVPPRSQGCLLGGDFDSRRERDVSDRSDKRDESQGCGTCTVISLGLLRKRFVKPKSRKLYRPYFDYTDSFFFILRDNDVEILVGITPNDIFSLSFFPSEFFSNIFSLYLFYCSYWIFLWFHRNMIST